MNDQDEMFEAATETPAFLGCPAHMPKTLPGGSDGVEPAEKKHTMDFGRFRVTRAAIPGKTVLTFRRKQEVDEKTGCLVHGRIIIAEISKKDVGGEKLSNVFVVKSYMPGEKPRVLFSGDSWVCMSKTEKIVYKMVKTDVKESQRRRILSKRKAAAAKQQADDNKAAAGEVK